MFYTDLYSVFTLILYNKSTVFYLKKYKGEMVMKGFAITLLAQIAAVLFFLGSTVRRAAE